MGMRDRMRRALRALLWLGCFVAAGVAAGAHAQSSAELAARRAELDDLQRRLAEIDAVIERTESSRSQASRQVAGAERAVSEAARALRETETALEETDAERVALERVLEEVEARIASREQELAGWLRRHYVHGGSGVAPLLSALDPNQLARDVRYLEYLGRARLEVIESLRGDQRARSSLMDSVAARRDELVALREAQQNRREALEKTLAARSRALTELEAQLRGQRHEADGLRDSEQRLAGVIEVLIRQTAEREREERMRRERQASQRTPPSPAPVAVVPRVVPPEPVPRSASGRVARPSQAGSEGLAGPTPTGVSFAQLRGKVGFPVRGELASRFGAPRAEGGTRWRGIFIRANGGEEVLAVASGEVVFSDWLRGYGNLIILDHGEDYLTIYGNNDVLFRRVGERIGGGVPIASVGSSGGERESGLYFEIRHKGEPVDPLQWIRAR